MQPSHTFAVQLNTARLRWLTAVLFFLSFVLLFFPWHRVLVPSMLVAGKPPPAPLRDVMLIVGCPASLNERAPSGDLKLEAVKKAAGDFIDKLPERMRLGLVLYGHKRDSECGAEVVGKLALLDSASRKELKEKIAAVNPVGLAPLAESLKAAGEELARNEAGGGIVLIADTVDTCDGDPVAQVKSLSGRLDLAYGINVLGFAVIPKDVRALRNIAQAGKGKFFDTQTMAELDEGLDTILKETRTTVEHDFIASSLANTTQSGWQMAFGGDPVPGSLLSAIYCILIFVGLLAAVAIVAVGVLPPLQASFGRFTNVLSLGLVAVAGAALLTLLLQMMLGFPIESDFSRYAFTYRRSWLYLAVLVNALALLSAWLLFRQEKQPALVAPKVQIDW